MFFFVVFWCLDKFFVKIDILNNLENQIFYKTRMWTFHFSEFEAVFARVKGECVHVWFREVIFLRKLDNSFPGHPWGTVNDTFYNILTWCPQEG